MEARILFLDMQHKSWRLVSNGGFTLVELVLALAIATMFLALVGSGLVVVSKQERAAAADRVSRYELQRALGFIGNEVQMAATVHPCPPDSPDFYTPANNSASHYPVVALTMPSASGLTKPIVYYVAAPPANSPWSGPLVIYRWGPMLTLDGTYSRGEAATSYSYYNEVVVDRIDAVSEPNACDGIFTAAIPDHPQGFSACVEPTGSAVKILVVRNSDAGRKAVSLSSIFSRRSRSFAATNSFTCPRP
jgi:prepilin-type N-terminal cleavage/methylation domain-containing protein